MSEEKKITVEDCEVLCNKVLAETNPTADEIFLWRKLWRELVSKLGQDDNPDFELFLHPRNPSEPGTPDKLLAATRAEFYELLDRHSTDSRACMKIFDRLRTTREK